MITTSAEEQSVMSTDWVATLGILNFVDLGLVPSSATCTCRLTPKQKRGGIRDAFVVDHFKQGRTVSMSFWFPYLQYWLIGWSVLWYLISCVMQIKWHWFPPKRFISQILLHLPQVQLSLESGHTQALSHYRLGIQSHTSNIFYKFPVGNLECTGQHQGCSCGSQKSVEEQSV